MHALYYFEDYKSLHIPKDPIQIPLQLKILGDEVTVLTFYIEKEVESFLLDNNIKVLKISSKYNKTLSLINFAIFHNVKKYDIFISNLLGYHNSLISFLFKIKHFNIVTHIKYDSNYKKPGPWINNFLFNKKSEHGRLKSFIIRKLHKSIDYHSFEDAESTNFFKSLGLGNMNHNNVFTFRNGTYNIKESLNEDRDKIIFTAARIGTHQKRSDLLLDAWVKSNLYKNFRLVIAGTIEEDFISIIDLFIKENPVQMKAVEFLGLVDSKVVSYYMRRSSFFYLVSEYEGNAISISESIENGCIPIISTFVSNYELIASAGVPIVNILEVEEILRVFNWIEKIDDSLVLSISRKIKMISYLFKWNRNLLSAKKEWKLQD